MSVFTRSFLLCIPGFAYSFFMLHIFSVAYASPADTPPLLLLLVGLLMAVMLTSAGGMIIFLAGRLLEVFLFDPDGPQ